MAAKDIVEAFEKEYEMPFHTNHDRARDFTNGWCAAKASEVKNHSNNSAMDAISGICVSCCRGCVFNGVRKGRGKCSDYVGFAQK